MSSVLHVGPMALALASLEDQGSQDVFELKKVDPEMERIRGMKLLLPDHSGEPRRSKAGCQICGRPFATRDAYARHHADKHSPRKTGV